MHGHRPKYPDTPFAGLAKLREPLRIGRRIVERRLNLAPMTYLGHVAFRELLSEFGGYGLLFTEMCDSAAIPRENRRTSCYFRWRDEERGQLVCQIFGREPGEMAAAAVRIESEGFFGVDINFGCTAGAICRRDCGAALLRSPQQAVRIVAAVRSAVAFPLTVKYRIGWEGHPDLAIELARRFEDAGADALTFHPRVAPDRRARPPRWEVIRLVKEAVVIPVFGNGNVFSAADGRRMLDLTGCDGIALGRLAVAQPWIFAAWNEDFTPPEDIYHRTARRLIELLQVHFEPTAALRRYHRFAYYFAANFKFANTFLNRVRRASDLAEAADAVDRFFESPPELSERLNMNFLL